MKDLNYFLFVIFMIPYMVVIAKMILHLMSYIAFNISYSVRNKRLDALNASFGIKEPDKKIQKEQILKTHETFYNLKKWFNCYLRFDNFSGWCIYCAISCIICFFLYLLCLYINQILKKKKLY